MITIILKNNNKKTFCLKDDITEKRYYQAWYSMRDEKKYINKKLRVKSHNRILGEYKIADIKNCIIGSISDLKTKEYNKAI